MTILTWKNDKDDIMYTLGRLNPKYLIGLFIKTKRLASKNIHTYMENEGMDYETAKQASYTRTGTSVVYDGVTFIVSFKTLKEEMNRRIEMGQVLVDPTATTNKTRWTVNKTKKK